MLFLHLARSSSSGVSRSASTLGCTKATQFMAGFQGPPSSSLKSSNSVVGNFGFRLALLPPSGILQYCTDLLPGSPRIGQILQRSNNLELKEDGLPRPQRPPLPQAQKWMASQASATTSSPGSKEDGFPGLSDHLFPRLKRKAALIVTTLEMSSRLSL